MRTEAVSGPVDLILVGASAGGVTALKTLARDLPSDLPAAVLIVLHTAPTGGYLAPILDAVGPLEAAFATDGESIRRGRIYVAPPDRHLVVRDDHLHLTRTPKENWTRPAINPLFRSAAAAFGPRVAAVVLTGMLDNGTAGLLAVQIARGITVVQDPTDAEFPEMPESALAYLDPNHVVPLAQLAGLLARLALDDGDADPGSGSRRAGEPLARQGNPGALDAMNGLPDSVQDAQPDPPSGFTCPECGGALWQHEEHGFIDYICRTGHRFSPLSLLNAQGNVRSDALEAALRAVREEQALAEMLIARGRERAVDAATLRTRVWRTRELSRLGDALEDIIRGPVDSQ